MRLYTFNNMYLSSIQCGIQTAHVTAELFVKYDDVVCDVEQQGILQEWANDHKTMILLNGGYGKNLHNIYELLSNLDCRYPFAKFHEEQDALDGALTCVGVVLPQRIYELVSAISSKVITAADLSYVVRMRQGNSGRSELQNHALNMYTDLTTWACGRGIDFDVAHALDMINDFDISLIVEIAKYRLAS